MSTATLDPVKTKRKKLVSPIFQISFPSLYSFEKQMDDATGKPKYSLTAVFRPAQFDAADKKRFADMKALLDEVSMEKFKRVTAKLPANFKLPLHDGAEKEHLTGFGEGTIYCRMTSLTRPGVVGSDRVTPILDPEAVYPGCYCRASLSVYSYDKKSKGLAFGLHNVMFIRDGERLDSRTNPEEDFGEVAVDSEDDDLT